MSIAASNPAFRELERQFNVVLPDTFGNPALGFRDGVWYRLSSTGVQGPVMLRSAILQAPHAAGSIVQIVCWWMRENNRNSRALDLATELAMTVSELARASSDELGSSLSDTPPPSSGFDPLTSPLPGSSGSFGAAALPASSPSWPPTPIPDPRLGDSLGGVSAPAPSYGLPSAPPPQPAAAATTVMPAVRPDGPAPFSGDRSGGDYRVSQEYRQPQRPGAPRPGNSGSYAAPNGYDRGEPRPYDDRPRRPAQPRGDMQQRPTQPRRDW